LHRCLVLAVVGVAIRPLEPPVPTCGAARELGIAVIALLEGAFVLARAMRTTEPLNAAGKVAAQAVKDALP